MRERFDRAIDAHLSSDRIQQSIDVVLQRELDSRIQEKDFAGVEAGGIVFDTESIAKDRLLVESIKKNFQKHIEHLDHEDVERIVENKKRADALEVVIAEAGELYNWAGENAFFIRSSESYCRMTY